MEDQIDPAPGSPRLAQQLRNTLRKRHYSYRTEKTYLHWMRRFIFFHNKRHPSEMGEPEVAAFLTHLAVQRQVSASTQNQALHAILCFFTSMCSRVTLASCKGWCVPSAPSDCQR